MTTYRVSVPSFLGGINQQSEAVRQNNLVEDARNIEFVASEGATKRYGSEHVAELDSGLSGYRLVVMERDEGDFLVCIGDTDIKAFEADGSEMVIVDTAGDSFAYLDGATELGISTQPIADTLFVLNRDTVTVGEAGLGAPSWAEVGEAAYFIKQNNYGVDFTITYKIVGQTEQTVRYSTPSAPGTTSEFWSGFEWGSGGPAISTGQVDGSLPFDLTGLGFNAADELTFIVNPTGLGSNGEATGGTTLNVDLFTADPLSKECFYVGNGAAPYGTGDVLNISRRNTISLTYFLRTDMIRRFMDLRLAGDSDLQLENSGLAGSTTRVYSTVGAFEKFEINDSQANTYAISWTTQVEQISDLPLDFKNGAVVKIAGQNSDAADDYFVEFTTDEFVDSGEDILFAETYGSGTWNETIERGLPDGGIDASTMPHTLVRKLDTTGSVPGVGIGNFYFEWDTFEYETRQAGDSLSNKPPSFLGEKINDIFFQENRLGFLSQTEVSMSEAGEQGNFWRTTVLSVPDSDRIDFTAADLDGDTLRHALPFDRALLVLTERSQAVVLGQPTLSPSTVSAPTVSRYRCIGDVPPALLGQSVFFATSSGDYAHVREFLPGEQENRVRDSLITLGVPRLIPSSVRRLQPGPADDMLFVLSEDRTQIFVYSYLRFDQQLLTASWSVWEFGGSIEDVGVTEDAMYALVTREGITSIEKLSLGAGRAQTGEDFVLRCDSQATIPPVSMSYDPDTNTTAFFLPYQITADEDLVVCAGTEGPLTFGTLLEITDRDILDPPAITVYGDHSSQEVIVGRPYNAYLTLSKPLAQKQGQEGSSAILDAKQTVRQFVCYVDRTGYLKATVTGIGGEESEDEFLVDLVDVGSFDTSQLANGEMRVGVYSDVQEFQLVLSSDSVLPFNIVNGAWDIRYKTKHQLL